MGDESGERPFRESDPPHPVGPYATSKLLAEHAVLEVATSTSLSVVILRSPLVYGPGVRANFLALMRVVDREYPLPFGAISNARSLIALDNLVDALLACGAQHDTSSEIYFAKDRQDFSIGSLIRALANALDRKARLIPVPPSVLRFAATLIGQGETLTSLIGNFAVDSTRITEKLGWRPPVSSGQALDATARWYRASA
jgi:UDP-glucose 4-epimerase